MTENIKNTEEKKDHLQEFIKSHESNDGRIQQNNLNIEQFGPNFKQKVDVITADSEWIEIPLNELPFGKFYKDGTHIFIRAAKTKEIESFSIINEKNPYDVQLKLNEILSACTKITFLNDKNGTYRDIQSGDRDTIVILISRISAKNGRVLQKSTTCECNTSQEIMIELIPANYVFKTEDADLTPYFDNVEKIYVFEMLNGTEIKLAPPTIGLEEDINSYIFYQTTKSNGKILPNVPLMQNLPYIKAGNGVSKLTIEQLEQEEFNFSKMNDEMFMVISDVVDKISFGIDKLKGKCTQCSQEVYAPFGFPDGPRALFIVPNAFKQFVRQRI